MKIDFVTLFPGMFPSVMDASMMARAKDKGLLEWACVNPRDFTEDKHHKVDDRPFGGGPGMLMMVEPLDKAIKSVRQKGSKVIFLSPQGKTFDDKVAKRLSREKHLILVCGHYEGVDERTATLFDEEISVGDFVLTGGELPAEPPRLLPCRALPPPPHSIPARSALQWQRAWALRAESDVAKR